MLFLSLLGNVVAVLAAIGAVFGDTWDPKRRGLNRLRPTGWVVAIAAIVGFALSTVGDFANYIEDKRRQRAAASEIADAWKALMYPFETMLWQLDRQSSEVNVRMTERLLADGTLEALNGIDLKGETPHYQGSWGEVLCKSTERGLKALEASQSSYVPIVDSDLISAMKDVKQAWAAAALTTVAPCGPVTFPAGRPGKLEMITNLGEFNRYLQKLRVLRLELDARL